MVRVGGLELHGSLGRVERLGGLAGRDRGVGERAPGDARVRLDRGGAAQPAQRLGRFAAQRQGDAIMQRGGEAIDRKSTRLNSSHLVISYAVFCLKKQKSRT